MIVIFYLFPIIGALLLLSDTRGALSLQYARWRWWRRVGLAATTLMLLAAVFVVARAPELGGDDRLVMLAAAHLALSLAYLVLSVGSDRGFITMQRIAYASLLILSLAPSWAFLALTPVVALAGTCLVRVQAAEAPSLAADDTS